MRGGIFTGSRTVQFAILRLRDLSKVNGTSCGRERRSSLCGIRGTDFTREVPTGWCLWLRNIPIRISERLLDCMERQWCWRDSHEANLLWRTVIQGSIEEGYGRRLSMTLISSLKGMEWRMG